MGDDNQYLDIIILGVIAAFIILRLRGVLGRRDESERNRNYRDPFRREGPDRGGRDDDSDNNVPHLPGGGRRSDFDSRGDRGHDIGRSVDEAVDENDPVAMGVADIRRHDPTFDPAEFLSGARMAFEMVLNAFVQGDMATLEPLLSQEVHDNFRRALDERRRAGETLEETLVEISKAEVVEAKMDGDRAVVSVEFVSERINCTRNADGEVLDGDPDAAIAITDIWTFDRDARSRDPNWFLVGTASPE